MQASEYIASLEAAQILGCAPDTVRGLARTGKLPVVMTTGAGRVYRRSDVERLAREREQQRAAAVEPTPNAAA